MEIVKNYEKLMYEIHSRRGDDDSSRIFRFFILFNDREIDLTQKNAHRSATRSSYKL